jgi:hypothetical protein
MIVTGSSYILRLICHFAHLRKIALGRDGSGAMICRIPLYNIRYSILPSAILRQVLEPKLLDLP